MRVLKAWNQECDQEVCPLQDTLEILQFLKPTRQHIKEGLVPDCSKALLGGGQAFDEMAFSLRSQGLNETSLHFSPEVVKALLVEPLTEEDLLKVGCLDFALPICQHHTIILCFAAFTRGSRLHLCTGTQHARPTCYPACIARPLFSNG